MNILKLNSDYIGIISASLCILHCAFTPILFLSQSELINTHIESPLIWRLLNLMFLFISFIAVFKSVNNSTNKRVQNLLFSAWALLCFFILNELLEGFELSDFYPYSAALFLSGMHFYNLKYCNCNDSECCDQKT